MIPEAMKNAINSLVWNYGRGDVLAIYYNVKKQNGDVTTKCQYGGARYRFRIENERTLKMIGHQRKIA